jgi:hypothetical protein
LEASTTKLRITRWDKKPPKYIDHLITMELELTKDEFNGLTREKKGLPSIIMKLLKQYIDRK